MHMNRLYKWISIADRFSKIYLDKRFKPLGLNSSQHMFIFHICQEEGISQDMLAKTVHINKSNVTRALSSLEKNGFIIKKQNQDDKRTSRLYPTPKAKRLYGKIREIENSWALSLTEDFSEEDKARINRLLQQVAQVAIRRVNEDG